MTVLCEHCGRVSVPGTRLCRMCLNETREGWWVLALFLLALLIFILWVANAK